MSISNDSLNKKLYQLLRVQGFDPIPKDETGETTPVPDEAEVFRFTYKQNGEPVGNAWITVDGNKTLKVYYDDKLMTAGSDDDGESTYSSFTDFLKQLKMWAQRRQLGFDTENQDHLQSDMAQREYMKKKERIAEGYYPMGKSASYSDAVPTVKIVLQHTRQIQEGEQRFRNIAKIFLENQQGERILAPTTKPGIAQVYARHIAEGGLPHDERWNHITSLCEEYQKMAGFVRATRGGQFNESAQQLVNEGVEHYHSLRESLGKMRGHRGYQAYFESWTPPLMEDDTDANALNELFVQETMDPRIESVMPILSRIHKKVNEMSEVDELAEWAESLVSEKMVMGASTDASAGGTFVQGESIEEATDEYSIPESELEEGLGDVAKKVGSALKTGAKVVSKAIVGKDDDELLRDLKKKAGVRNPQTGKPSMAMSDVEKVDEDLGPEQKKVGQLGPTEKVKNNNIGKLVGANESVELSEMDSEGYKGARDNADDDAGKKQIHLGPKHMAKAKDVAKDAENTLNAAFDKEHNKVVQGADLKTVAKADLGKNKLNLPKGYGDVVQPQKVKEGQEDLDAILRIIRK